MDELSRRLPSTQLIENVGACVRRLREGAGISQGELAQKIYVSRQTVNNWERGKTLPDLESLEAMARYFGVTVDEFLCGTDADAIRRAADARHELLVLMAGSLGMFLLYVCLCALGIALGVHTLRMGAGESSQAELDTVSGLRFLVSLAGLVVIIIEGRFERRFDRAVKDRGLQDAVQVAAYMEGRPKGSRLPDTFLYRTVLPHWGACSLFFRIGIVVMILLLVFI